MAGDESLERLINVFEILVSTDRPLTHEEILDSVPGFPQGREARLRAFERVKFSLRDLGIPVEVVTLPGKSVVGYRIRREDVELDLDFTPEEAGALESALGCASFADGSGTVLNSHFGILYRQAAPIIWQVSDLSHVPEVITDALRRSREVSFVYRGTPRTARPYGLLSRWGRVYLVAETVSGELRNYRADRLQEPIMAGASFERSPGRDLGSALPPHPWLLEVDDLVEIRLSGPRAALAALGAQELEPVGDGAIGTAATTNVDLVIADLISYGGEVLPVAPPAIRARMRAAVDENLSSLGSRWSVGGSKRSFPRQRRRPQSIQERFAMVSNLLAFLRSRGNSARLTEVAGALGLPVESVASLLETVSLCGIPPYSPDVLLEVVVDREEDYVEVSLESPLAKPKRVGPIEAMIALATVEAVVAAAGDELAPEDLFHLRAARGKMEAALSAQILDSLVYVDDLDLPPEVGVLRGAIVAGACVEFQYASPYSAIGPRHVAPLQIFALSGLWYLYAAGESGPRRYRLDRISQIRSVPTDGCVGEQARRAALSELQREDLLALEDGIWMEVRADPAAEVVLDYLARGNFEPIADGRFSVVAHSDAWAAGLILALGARASGEASAAALALARKLGSAIATALSAEGPG